METKLPSFLVLSLPSHLMENFFSTVLNFSKFIFVYVVNIRFICDGEIYLLTYFQERLSRLHLKVNCHSEIKFIIFLKLCKFLQKPIAIWLNYKFLYFLCSTWHKCIIRECISIATIEEQDIIILSILHMASTCPVFRLSLWTLLCTIRLPEFEDMIQNRGILLL